VGGYRGGSSHQASSFKTDVLCTVGSWYSACHHCWGIHNVLFNNGRYGELVHASHIPSIKCDPVMSQAISVLVTSKVAVRRESLSHRSFGSALVAENGVRLDLRFQVISIICQTFFYGESCRISPSYVPSIDLSMNPGPSRYIFLSLSHLDLCYGASLLIRPMPQAFFSRNFVME